MSKLASLKRKAREAEVRNDRVQAIELYGRAVSAARADGAEPFEVGRYNRIGDLYLEMDDTSQAVYHYLLAAEEYAEEAAEPEAAAEEAAAAEAGAEEEAAVEAEAAEAESEEPEAEAADGLGEESFADLAAAARPAQEEPAPAAEDEDEDEEDELPEPAPGPAPPVEAGEEGLDFTELLRHVGWLTGREGPEEEASGRTPSTVSGAPLAPWRAPAERPNGEDEGSDNFTSLLRNIGWLDREESSEERQQAS